LTQKPVDITPSNAERKFAWTKAANIDDFEREYSFKPVQVRGIFDHNQEFKVEKE
jgi:hypothetical protein